MPDITDVHVDAALTNVAIGYETRDFIAPRLLKDIPVKNKSGLYYTFDSTRRAAADVDDAREPGTAANSVDFDVSTASYLCQGHALSAKIPDEEREEADPVIKPEVDKTEFLTSRLLVAQEIALESALSTDVTQTSDPTNEWDDYTNGDPIADMHLAINTVEDSTGFTPNVCAMDSKVWRSVRKHPDIIQYSLYGGTNSNPAEVSLNAFASMFDLDEVIVAASQKNTAVEGQAASISRVWGSDVYVAYRPANAGMKVPALGYRYVWRPFTGGRFGFKASRWRDNPAHSDVVELQKYYDQKITLATAAYRLQNRLS